MIGFGQNDDVIKLQNEVNDINYKMGKHHKQLYTGVTLNLVGVAVSVIAVLAPFNPLIYIGSAVVLSGNIVMLDSHKWFKNKDISALKVEDNDNKIEKRKKQLKELLLKGSINKEEYDDAIKSIEQFKTID